MPAILLHKFKKEQGWTQKWLAEKTGTNDRAISEIIRSGRVPTLKLAIRIAKVVGAPVEEIWEEVE